MHDRAVMAEDRVREFEVHLTRVGLGLAHRMGNGVSGVLLDRFLRLLAGRHPRAFATLRGMRDARLLIDPVDAPAAVMLHLGPALSLRVCDRGAEADAAVRGPCSQLLDLMEGQIDGDALFFRRELTIEGDTALILELRNTLDGEEIDLLSDIATAAAPLRIALPVVRRNGWRLLELMDTARRLAPPPVRWGLAALERRVVGPQREA